MGLRCETCQHYRPGRRGRLIQNLARELMPHSEEVLSRADRQRQREDEAQSADSSTARQMGLWAEEWESRPLMEHYCGVDEHLDRFYVVEIKEPDCRQHEQSSVQRSCATCAFHRAPSALETDRAKLLVAARHEAMSKSFYQGMLAGRVDRERQIGRDRRGFAIEEALTSAMAPDSDEQYFSTCKRMDYENQGTRLRVLCAWANPTGTCGYWSGSGSLQWDQPAVEAASFRRAGFRFEQECAGQATYVQIYATRFTGFIPRGLKFRLDWLPPNETRSFAGITAARITVKRLPGTWQYSLYPLQQAGKGDPIIGPTEGYGQ